MINNSDGPKFIKFFSFCQVDNSSANQINPQNSPSEIEKLRAQLQSAQLPASLHDKAIQQIDRISLTLKYGGNLAQLDITAKYIDWITNLPWDKKSEDVLDINKAKVFLDQNHYGLEAIKRRVLEYLSVLALQKQNLKTERFHAPNLFFVGLAGTGKTTFAKSIAESMGRKLVRIPFGGLSSAQDLRGQSKTSPEAEPGMVMKAIRRAGTKNPVILLDELDRCTPESRSSIMGVLIELLDPQQNAAYVDYFIDYPFDLSQCLFVATANNTNSIATAVMDRLELIQMPSYNDQDKIEIGKRFVFPRFMKESGLLPDQLKIEDAVWAKMVRPLGFEPGIRSLEREIETIVRKIAYKIISGQGNAFTINEENMKEFVS
ncbi:MAG: AAA family ATPase [Patescibacteria group bacterium]